MIPAILNIMMCAFKLKPLKSTSTLAIYRHDVHLLRGQSEGNMMVKVQQQIQENHVQEYLQHKDLYTTFLLTIEEPGGIAFT